MENKFNRVSGFLAIVLGAVFLFSSSLKSVASGAFAQQLKAYGLIFTEYFSPIIIVVEALLGIALLFGLYQKYTAAVTAIVLVVFTVFYTYGLCFFDISDCGCFGEIHLFNSNPLWFYLRNGILSGMAIFIYFYPSSGLKDRRNARYTIIAMIICGCVVAYLSGRSSLKIHKEEVRADHQPIAIADSPLRDLIITNPDSTYLVFAFSYTCPHCLNSIANLNEYEKAGVVDKVIGVARRKSEDNDFNSWFKSNFTIVEISPDEKMIAKELPTSYYIRNDSVIQVFQGEIPCAFLFAKIIKQM